MRLSANEAMARNVVDPDPFTVASTFIAAAALALQYVQYWQSRSGEALPAPRKSQNLLSLEEACGKCQTTGDRMLRLMDLGCQNVDTEFYAQPFRIGKVVYLEASILTQYRHTLMDFMMVVSHVGMWVNHIIAEEPDLAARIGSRLSNGLGDIVAHLNRIMAEGLTNREAIQSAKQVLAALAGAIEAEINSGN